ncbi:MAG: SIS domain-containing protein [Methanomicrobiaceae archaeon]|nr:SIS domain-containing protein [Methanomicrobiaceae archaeon]
MEHAKQYMKEVAEIAEKTDLSDIEKITKILIDTKETGGRLFFIGVGGSAGNCSHAVNDFRKLAGIETYSPVDNVSELTARTNDEGWDTVFSEWLKTSRINSKDAVFVLSVGGGDLEKNVSANLVKAVDYAKSKDAKVLGILGKDSGYTAKNADARVVIPAVNPQNITPHSESFQGVILHLIASDPRLKEIENKWESLE